MHFALPCDQKCGLISYYPDPRRFLEFSLFLQVFAGFCMFLQVVSVFWVAAILGFGPPLSVLGGGRYLDIRVGGAGRGSRRSLTVAGPADNRSYRSLTVAGPADNRSYRSLTAAGPADNRSYRSLTVAAPAARGSSGSRLQRLAAPAARGSHYLRLLLCCSTRLARHLRSGL